MGAVRPAVECLYNLLSSLIRRAEEFLNVLMQTTRILDKLLARSSS